MPKLTLHSRPATSYLRSTALEEDFERPDSLDGYVFTESAAATLRRVGAALEKGSTQRAWRITGDYGCGKSSFAVLLARLWSGKGLPRRLREVDGLLRASKSHALFPILLTASRAPLPELLRRAMRHACAGLSRGDLPLDIQRSLRADTWSDDDALSNLLRLHQHFSQTQAFEGLLFVVDELGKFLEFAALNPGRSDVLLLQRIAERAARSGRHPLVLVGLLQQGFQAYATHLPPTAQLEWEKVAGRFEEVVFEQPIEDALALIADAASIRGSDSAHAAGAEKTMREAIRLGCYGRAAASKLVPLARLLAPLHATVPPVLVRFLRRYGQHERSLVAFLSSNEPFGLRDWLARRPSDAYRLSNLYDYVRANFGRRLSDTAEDDAWSRTLDVLDASGLEREEHELLKTVAVLNLVSTEQLRPTAPLVGLATGLPHAVTVLEKLRARDMLYRRPADNSYCPWPPSSVSLERVYRDARVALGTLSAPSSAALALLKKHRLVARKHYVETGTLRYFDVDYSPLASAGAACTAPLVNDGRLVVVLPDDDIQHDAAMAFARKEACARDPRVLVAVAPPLAALKPLLDTERCWRWIVQHAGEVQRDAFALREATRQHLAAKERLQVALSAVVALENAGPGSALRLFYRGKFLEVRTGRELARKLSRICSNIFESAPHVHNELVNRRSLSSAAAKARFAFIEHLLDQAEKPELGLDTRRAPPERAIYLSIMKAGGMHRQNGEAYRVVEPGPAEDACRLAQSFEHIRHLLKSASGGRVGLPQLMATLAEPPIGARDGLIPIILAIFFKANESNIAVYERGSFLQHLGGVEFLRLMKAPETFAMQWCELAGDRIEVLEEAHKALGLTNRPSRVLEVLDVVTPLCQRASRLSEYARRTDTISVLARDVRRVLVDATDPGLLLFEHLPRACGLQPFVSGLRTQDRDRVRVFVLTLARALGELEASLDALRDRLERRIFDALELGHGPDAREVASARARAIQGTVRDLQLRGFCLRLCDDALPRSEWIDAVASFVCAKPPARWSSVDEVAFVESVSRLGKTVQRVESLAFGIDALPDGEAYRLVVTRTDGSELDRVVRLHAEDSGVVQALETRILTLFPNPAIATAVISRLLWRALGDA